MIRVEYKTRQGVIHFATFEYTEDAHARLDHLDALERENRRWAPTDSGSVRFDRCAEADAIRKALYFPEG